MSRTFRLRHERSNVAVRFGDAGSYRLSYLIKRNEAYNHVAHHVYEMDCAEVNDFATYVYPYAKPVPLHVSHDVCMCQLNAGWYMERKTIDMIEGVRFHSIRPVEEHEYAHRVWNTGKRLSYFNGRAERRRAREVMSRATADDESIMTYEKCRHQRRWLYL